MENTAQVCKSTKLLWSFVSVFKSTIVVTQSKHRKCQQLFTESFLKHRKIKYFLFVKQSSRMCRVRDDQKMTSTYHHSHETLSSPPPIPSTIQAREDPKTPTTRLQQKCKLLYFLKLTNTMTGGKGSTSEQHVPTVSFFFSVSSTLLFPLEVILLAA